MFVNRTIRETRYYEHVYHVYKPADSTFCTYNVPEESANVLGSGICGENGYVTVGEKFGTATFEKDGSIKLFMTTGRYAGGDGNSSTVDEDTFYYSIGDDKSFEYHETESFTNALNTRMAGNGQYFIISESLPYSDNPLAESFTYQLNQVSETTFKDELERAYDANDVRSFDRKPIITDGNCVDTSRTNCPDESMWRMYDPLYNPTPYEEDVGVKGGWIAFFVLIGALFLFGALYAWHVYRINKQADRFKHQFARRIAETINLDHDKKLSAQGLEDEFKAIDVDGDGVVTKEELHSFMGDSVSQQDFNVMFAAIDIDHSGAIDFAEFCAFMSQIGAILSEEEHKVATYSDEAPGTKEENEINFEKDVEEAAVESLEAPQDVAEVPPGDADELS